MTVVAQVTIAAESFELGEILSTETAIEIELTQFVPIETHPIPYIWVETADVEAFEAAVRADSRVTELERHDQRAERTLYHIEWESDLDGFLGLVERHDILVERGHGTAEEWTFQLRLPDSTSLRTFHSRCQDEDLSIRIDWISETDIRAEQAEASAIETRRNNGSSPPWQGEQTAIPSPDDRERFPARDLEQTTPFQAIVENLDEVIWMTDPDKEELHYVNPAYEEVWGRPRAELYEEPRSFLEAIHPDDRERVRAALESQPEDSYDQEYRIEQPDGTVRWIHDRAVAIRTETGTAYRVAGIAEDITERKNRERELSQTSHTLEALATSFPDLAFVIDEDGYYREYLAGPETEPLLAEEPAELLDANLHDVLPAAVADEILSAIRRSLDTGDLQTVEYQLDLSAGSRWFEARITPMQPSPIDAQSVVFVTRDITQQKKRERILSGLHDATRRLFHADSREDVAELAVQTARDRIQLPLVAVYFFDQSAGVLRPTAHTSDVTEVFGDLPTFTGAGSLAWNAFVTGETRVYDNVQIHERAYNPETPVRSELIVPLGDYGVLLAGSTTIGAFGETDTAFAELLATNTEAALDHVSYERDLERQNDRLVELTRLNNVIRSINKVIVDATTREEIAAKVCANIVENDSYRAAWVGEYRTDQEITVRAAAGDTGAMVDSEDGERIPVDDDSVMEELVGTASETRAVYVMEDFRDEANVDPWHEQLLDEECRGVVAVPLRAGEALYGILMVYTTDPDAFAEEEVAILRELGQTIGRAIRAAEARRALVTEAITELKFEITDTNAFFVAASADFECQVSLEGLVPLEEGRLLYYITVDGAPPDALRERAARTADIETCRLVTETDDGCLFEFRVAGASAVYSLIDYGATVRSAVADHGTARVTAEIAPEMDARTLLNGLRRVCPSASVIGKRNLDRPVQTVHQFRDSLTDQLTEKQLNALQTAYFAGYFEWPRESTAEEIAEPMDVAASTLHFHLRNSLRKLLSAFLETQDTK